MSDDARISPTAHYTGYVWYRHGLSPAALATQTGRAMFAALRGPMAVAALTTGGLTLERTLLQRHGLIDHLLDEAIADGRVGQVVEVAAGMSGRGLRFMKRHPELIYIEGDLPGMVARKRRHLQALPALGPRHHVVAIDAMRDDGPSSLNEMIAPLLSEGVGTAVITEGLLSYFSTPDVEGMWRRFARLIEWPGAGGLYLSDLHIGDASHHQPFIAAFRRFLGAFARGQIHLHYGDTQQACAALTARGFDGAAMHRPQRYRGTLDIPQGRGDDYVTVLAATITSPRTRT